MPNSRYLITLLVAAQIIAHSVGDLSRTIQSPLIAPLLYTINPPDGFRIGPFNIGNVIGASISCLIAILLGLLLLALVFKLAGKWIDRLIPPSAESLKKEY